MNRTLKRQDLSVRREVAVVQDGSTLSAEEFELGVMTLLPELSRAAARLTGNRADADDLVADAVARAWEKRSALRDVRTFRGWIFTILTNRFLSDRRAAGPSTEPLPEEDDEGFSLFERVHQPFLLWWGNPETEFLNRLLKEDLERAIASLPDEFRAAVLLADVHGLSYREVAAALDVPIGTVRSRLARARARLQKSLWQQAVDAGIAREPRANEESES